MKSWTAIRVLTAVCFLPASFGKEVETKRQARFYPVGDAPPFRQVIRDGVRYELEPPSGSIPPQEVSAGSGDGSAGEVTLRLGRISAPVDAPAGEAPLVLRRKEDAPQAGPWLGFPQPESGDYLVYLWRKPGKKTWDDVSSLVVPGGPLGHPAGTVRITNLYPLAVRIVWGGETLTLPGGKTILRKVSPGAELPFRILVAGATGGMKSYYSGAVTQNPGERGFITIYRADGVAPRRPVKVSMQREPASSGVREPRP